VSTSLHFAIELLKYKILNIHSYQTRHRSDSNNVNLYSDHVGIHMISTESLGYTELNPPKNIKANPKMMWPQKFVPQDICQTIE